MKRWSRDSIRSQHPPVVRLHTNTLAARVLEAMDNKPPSTPGGATLGASSAGPALGPGRADLPCVRRAARGSKSKALTVAADLDALT
eukprot:6460628-Amphidinium_carterae.1